MKKAIIILVSVIAIGASAGIALYVKSLPPEPAYYGFKDSFTSDISGSKKHVVFKPALKLNKSGHDAYLDKNAKLIINVILFSIREKTEEELADNNVINEMSDKIISELGEQMDVGFIESIFFEQFYIG